MSSLSSVVEESEVKYFLLFNLTIFNLCSESSFFVSVGCFPGDVVGNTFVFTVARSLFELKMPFEPEKTFEP